MSAPRAHCDMDFWQEAAGDFDFEFFAEMQQIKNAMLRIEAEHLLRARSQRERFEYVNSRGSSSLERRELRTSVPTREIS